MTSPRLLQQPVRPFALNCELSRTCRTVWRAQPSDPAWHQRAGERDAIEPEAAAQGRWRRPLHPRPALRLPGDKLAYPTTTSHPFQRASRTSRRNSASTRSADVGSGPADIRPPVSAAEIAVTVFLRDAIRRGRTVQSLERSIRAVQGACRADPVCRLGGGRLVPRDEVLKLRQIGSDLEGHPTPRLSFVDVATGSLGQGHLRRGGDRPQRPPDRRRLPHPRAARRRRDAAAWTC